MLIVLKISEPTLTCTLVSTFNLHISILGRKIITRLTYWYPFTLINFLRAVLYFCGQRFHQTDKVPIRATEAEVVLVTKSQDGHKLRLDSRLLLHLPPSCHRQVLTCQSKYTSNIASIFTFITWIPHCKHSSFFCFRNYLNDVKKNNNYMFKIWNNEYNFNENVSLN